MKHNYCWTLVGSVAFVLALAFSGCQSNPPSKTAERQTPSASPLHASPVGQAAVSTSESTTTITGNGKQSIPAINCDLGAYLVDWTSAGGGMSISFGDTSHKHLGDIGLGEPKGQELFLVNNDPAKPGAINLEADAEGPWTITLTKVDAATAAALPVTVSGAELQHVISKPFHAKSGSLTITYTFKGKPRHNGVLNIWDATTGKNLWTNHDV